MSQIRYFFRTHLKYVTFIYQWIRRIARNAYHFRKMSLRKIKNADMLFFVIDPNIPHPGLADRIKAIIACYNQAKKNGLCFKIIFDIPFRLQDFLVPSFPLINDWRADYSDLEYSWCKTHFVNERTGWLLKAHKGCQYHVYNYKGDIIPEIFPDTGYRWTDLYNELFTPSEEIKQAVDAIGLQPRSYIAIHLRFVNALESFEEGHYNSLKTEQEKRNLINRCRGGIQKIMSDNPNEKVLVFSDSKRFIREINDLGVITLSSDRIAHTCFSQSHAQIVKTFLDQTMISRATAVYMITAVEMYRFSGFSLVGARIGGIEFNTIEV